jgi:glyoxylase-like metal-dependent hydrolase (beta-lactamase superfamily II)
MHEHGHTHQHGSVAHTQTHSRRDLFARTFGGILAGASVFEEAFLRATWARAQSTVAPGNLFRIEKVADGVFAALAKPQIMINCNAAIFVNSDHVVVLDAHSKPSAAASLINQIGKEITTKPVRYLINSHFHWDHTQGDSAYKAKNPKVTVVASDTTKELMSQLGRDRAKESVDSVPKMIDGVQAQMSKAKTPADRAYWQEQIRQLNAYRREMENYTPELPTLTFAKSYTLKNPAGDLHLEFHGRAHTAGDIVVFSPEKRVIASGDMISGFLPNMNDGYPKEWPDTITAVEKLAFDQTITGHGPVQHDKARIDQLRSYIEELTARVQDGKKAGKSLAELQKTITVGSLNSLRSNGYAEYVAKNLDDFTVHFGVNPFESRLAGNIEAIYQKAKG